MTTATKTSRLTARAVLSDWHLTGGFELAIGEIEQKWVWVNYVSFGDRATIIFWCPYTDVPLTIPADQEIEIRRA